MYSLDNTVIVENEKLQFSFKGKKMCVRSFALDNNVRSHDLQQLDEVFSILSSTWTEVSYLTSVVEEKIKRVFYISYISFT